MQMPWNMQAKTIIRALLTACLTTILLSPSHSQAESLQAVWAGKQANGGFDLFISHLADGAWSKADRIVSSPEDDITPAMAVDRAGHIWLVWIARDRSGRSVLHYQMLENNTPILSGTIDSGFEYNYAPSLLIDRDDRAWAAWSSLDDEDEDIFASRFDGKTWSAPVRINTNDTAPDIKPILALDTEGAVLISWESLEANGYERFQSRWDGSGFGKERLVQDRDWIDRHTRHVKRAGIALPGIATQFGMAALVFPATDGIQSVPFSILQSIKPPRNQPTTRQ